MGFESGIKLVGQYGLVGALLFVGYLLYDKDTMTAKILLFVGICCAVALVWSEISFKNTRHQHPTLFDKYKGE